MQLNEAQGRALSEILDHHEREPRGSFHSLTGNAGTGKTFLMMAVVEALKARMKKGRQVAVTAPTHKAVNVLKDKMDFAGLDVPSGTIHSILGLKVTPDGEKQKLRSTGRGSQDDFDVIVLDECSMVGLDLIHHVRTKLEHAFVLYVGDPAQLPPVGEEGSETFNVRERSHLDTIVRQAEGNPIIAASQIMRDAQDRNELDWSWTQPVDTGSAGIFHVPQAELDDWLRYEFTSEAFRDNPDMVRYLCYTNAQVASVNAKIRRWVYGHTETPFVPGELAICRAPVMMGESIAFSTNQEEVVQSIEAGVERFFFPALPETGFNKQALPAFEFELHVWKMRLGDDGVPCMIPRFDAQYKSLLESLRQQALRNSGRWFERFQLQEKIGTLQHHYAMTTHVSQGSTFGRVFIDMPDLMKSAHYNQPKAVMQLCYVAATRPTDAVGLIGAPAA